MFELEGDADEQQKADDAEKHHRSQERLEGFHRMAGWRWERMS